MLISSSGSTKRASGSGRHGQGFTLSLCQVLLLCALVATTLIAAVGRLQRCAPLLLSPAGCPPDRRVATRGAMANEQPALLRRPVVLLFGDSLTERSFDPEGGWGAAVAHHFARKADIVNRGFGGYNSRWALPVLDQILHQLTASGQEVLFATIWLGANDAALPDRSAARQHVPLPDYAANLEAMVGKLRASGVARVLLVAPPPVYDAGRIKHQQERNGTRDPIDPDRTNAFTGEYAEAVRALGRRVKAPVLDLYTLLQREDGWETGLLSDGLHFTPTGQAMVGQLVIDTLREAYPELRIENLSNHFPWWDQLAEAGHAEDAALFKRFLAHNARPTQ